MRDSDTPIPLPPWKIAGTALKRPALLALVLAAFILSSSATLSRALMLLAPVPLVLAAYFWYVVTMVRVLRRVEDAAKRKLLLLKRWYGIDREFREACAADYSPLDLSIYHDRANELIAAGFRPVRAVVDTTAEKLFGWRTVIWLFASLDATTLACVWQHKSLEIAAGTHPNPRWVQEFTTEFTDGIFIGTSNEPPTADSSSSAVQRGQLGPETSLSELLIEHENAKRNALRVTPEISCVEIRTLEEALASIHREHALQRAFRRPLGYLDPEEIWRLYRRCGADEKTAQMYADVADDVRTRELEAAGEPAAVWDRHQHELMPI
ncbi:MAG TPA: hypothetical protein VFC78_07060 [Tepidisphaeraceae bacterium]|nr:hypothetical protein [Tepidisphaeraceae bacterium]